MKASKVATMFQYWYKVSYVKMSDIGYVGQGKNDTWIFNDVIKPNGWLGNKVR